MVTIAAAYVLIFFIFVTSVFAMLLYPLIRFVLCWCADLIAGQNVTNS